jgi:hypothetical protein
MSDSIRILTVEPDGDDGLIVTFSDGTTAGYVVEELLDLRPCREQTTEPTALGKPSSGLRLVGD